MFSQKYRISEQIFNYGAINDNSDLDVYGFSIPPKQIIFPGLRGEILGFDDYQIQFSQFDKYQVVDAVVRDRSQFYFVLKED